MLFPLSAMSSRKKAAARRRRAHLELCPEFLEQRLLLTSLVPSPNPTPGGPPPSSTPPAIVGEQILTAGQGKHTHLVGFELIFNEALDVSRARRAANYIVTQTDKVGHMVVARRVKLHVEYSPESNAVNLMLSGRPTFGLGGQIDVNASPPAGVTNTSGDDLVGGPLHLPGIDPVLAILPEGRGKGGLVSVRELEAPYFNAGSQDLLNRAITAVAGGDTEPPVVSIASPVNGATVSGVVNVVPTVSDNVGVARVELLVDGILMATSTSAPFILSYDSSGDEPGILTLQLRAYDGAGNVGSSKVIGVNLVAAVTAAPPTVTFLNPTNGAKVAGTITVSIAATSTIGIASVTLRADGVSLGTLTAPPYNFTWNTLTKGNHNLQATAVDTLGQSTLNIIHVTSNNVDKVKPRVVITSPRPNASLGPNLITVTVNATDNTQVARVVLLVDGKVVASLTTGPFDMIWNAAKIKAGKHSLQAKAFDIFNNFGLSQKVAIHRVNVAKVSVSHSAEKQRGHARQTEST